MWAREMDDFKMVRAPAAVVGVREATFGSHRISSFLMGHAC